MSRLHPRIEMFLRDRDAARARGDLGIDRAITADLRRLGVRDDATATEPFGPKRKPKLTTFRHCEHGGLAEHCVECTPELLAR